MNPVSQRDSFWNKVYELAREDTDVMIVSADMGAPALDKFRKDLSQQYVNTGIAEQNAVLVAAGLALEGKKVFAYAIAPFITYRCIEQIKLYLAAMKVPVTLVGVGSGISYDDSGPTHHTIEDISMLRVLPNFTIHNTTDSAMATALAEISCRMDKPNYVRLDRKMASDLYDENSDFSVGVASHREGSDLALVATGNMVYRALEVAEALAKEKVSASVTDVYSIPVNGPALLDAVGTAERIVTMEEHALPGGFGSAVLEVLSEQGRNTPVLRLGMDISESYCYKYGGREHMQGLYGLDTASVLGSIKAWAK